MEGIVYMIMHKQNSLKYIGSTTEGIKKRWSRHQSDFLSGRGPNRSLHKAYSDYGFDNFMIIELKTYDIVDLRQLRAVYEQLWINKFGLDNLLNDSNNFIPSKEHIAARNKEYYEENKEEASIRSKLYYEKNKESIIAGAKRYREENSEACKQRAALHHQKNKEKHNAAARKHYEEKKDDILEYQKKYAA